MKKIFIAALVVFFTSCSSDNTLPPSENIQTYPQGKLKSVDNVIHLEIVQADSDSVTRTPYDVMEKYTYIYGKNEFVSKEIKFTSGYIGSQDTEFIIEYSYDDGKVHSHKTYWNGEFTSTHYYMYTDDLITRRESGRTISNYIYNSSKELIREEYYMTKDEPKPNYFFDYTYKDGNVIRIETIDNYNYKNVIEVFEYDDKKNPYNEMYPEALLKVLKIGKNNPINKNDLGYMFNYNSMGYPIARTSNDNSSDTTYEYFK